MKDLRGYYGIDLKDMEKNLHNLMMAGLELSKILDQPIEENGLIEVRYNWVAEKLFRVQQNIREVISDFYNISDYFTEKETGVEQKNPQLKEP